MIKAAITGFGRIGRIAFRVWHQNKNFHENLDIAAINTSGSMPIASWAHLLKNDTVYGKFAPEIKIEELQKPKLATDENPLLGYFEIESKKYPVLAQRDPSKLPWQKYQIDLVIEATGAFRTQEKASAHLKAGAKKVLISAPGKGGNIGSYIVGVKNYQGDHDIADNASCTTNCVAPAAAVIQAKFGIKKAALTTIHAYTDSQNLQDSSHKDLRLARAAAQNIIPASTGAAIATTKTIPELKGVFDGSALRVPVIIGSIADLTFVINKKTTVEEVNSAFQQASQNPLWQGILAVSDEPLVSSDIIGRPESSIVDLSLTKVIDGDLVKVFAWYDNEWGYCNSLLKQAILIAKTLN